MSQSFVINKVEYKDLSEIFHVQKEIFGEDALLMEWIEDFYGSDAIFHKIETHEKELIGVICIQTDNSITAYMYVLFIKPEYQRKGLGGKLLKNTLEEVRNQNYTRVSLHTKDYNETGINFYKKFNFVIAKKIEKYYRSGDNSYEMILDL